MQENSDSNSFYDSGKEFENYIEDVLFPDSNFVLEHKTHDNSQNKKRFVESSSDPDFRFRCKKSKQVFWVEAKWRTNPSNDDLIKDIIDLNHFRKYEKCNKPESPVFIAIGYEGSPSLPKHVSLIPLNEIKHESIYKTVLKKYEVQHNQKAFTDLTLDSSVQKAFPRKAKKSKKTALLIPLGITLIAILIVLLIFNQFNDQTILKSKEQLIQNQIKESSAKLLQMQKKQLEDSKLQQEQLKKEKTKNKIGFLVTTEGKFSTGLFLGGIENLSITLQNKTDYLLDSVRVQVNYINSDNETCNTHILNFHYLPAHSQRPVPAPDCDCGEKVRCEFLSIKSKALDL